MNTLYLLRMYLAASNINYIKQIVPKIDELSLTYKVKCYLKTFLLDPANITKKLINNMIYGPPGSY